jgi:hypothetical protein
VSNIKEVLTTRIDKGDTVIVKVNKSLSRKEGSLKQFLEMFKGIFPSGTKVVAIPEDLAEFHILKKEDVEQAINTEVMKEIAKVRETWKEVEAKQKGEEEDFLSFKERMVR